LARKIDIPIRKNTLSLGKRLSCLCILAMLATPVAAQSCAMCYTTVAGGGQGVIQALKSGIIVLLVPPLFLFTGLVVVILRWRSAQAQP
jgi:hypothetical protein